MPELPEVETVRRGLLPHLVGRRIEAIEARVGRLRGPLDAAALREKAAGRRIEGLRRRAKYLIADLEGEAKLIIHLGMTGRLLLKPREEPPARHDHVVFHLEGGLDLRFQDARRFGLVEVLSAAELEADERFLTLGVEPLSRAASAAHFYKRSRRLKKPVKNFLMDFHHVAGIGNIYASEALFLAGIHPGRSAGGLSLERWGRLVRAVKKVLRDSIRRGGTTFRDFRNSSGEAGYFQVLLRVYDRAGEPCRRCRRPIQKKVMAGRSTFYCPSCQR
ncbi:MAG: bifunctional DNA-formamidopyrimidine glycosylase/DNA-(apurinic or apyrimidinic site) lyase [Planctomycetes bacterium]|nr:bifunctional DNA-formamidopyrimidine glycosylase/DNA-(apurinic or apyrimidinic site) lyase [Planctomycetota bacterium]